MCTVHVAQVFGSRLLELALSYKWNEYGRYIFGKHLIFYILHVVFATAYNTHASATISVPPRAAWGVGAAGAADLDLLVVLGWVWTSLFSLWWLWGEILQVEDIAFLTDSN